MIAPGAGGPGPPAAAAPGLGAEMELAREERVWRDGRGGEGTRVALELVIRMGELLGAARLLPVGQARIDACLYTNDAGLEFAERPGGARRRGCASPAPST